MPTIGSSSAPARARARGTPRRCARSVSPKMRVQRDRGRREQPRRRAAARTRRGCRRILRSSTRVRRGERHAGTSVSSKNSCSSPAPSAGASRVRATPPASAASPDGERLGVDDQAGLGAGERQAGGGERARQRLGVRRRDERARARQQLVARAGGHDPPAADDHQPVGHRLDLAQQVRGQQHGPAAVGEVAQQRAHPAHALGVEPVGRLVEDQHLRVADQRVRDPQPLAHAERVLPAPACARRRRRGRRARAARPRARPARRAAARSARAPRARAGPGCCAAASSSTPTRRPGYRQRRVGPPSTAAEPRVRAREPDEHPQRGRSCRRRWARGSPVTVPGSQRSETSLTTVRPPRRFVSPVASIMPPASAPRPPPRNHGRRSTRDRLR